MSNSSILPIHPLTGLRALGVTRKGRPVWPVLGGSEDEGGGGGGDDGNKPKDGEGSKSFTQDEVNQLVGKARTEERRKATDKYADYDDLRKAADGKKTSDDRLAELEKQYAQSQANALRLRIAGDYGISTKRGEDGSPSDAELFLTGTDEDSLVAQAERLAAREAERAKNQPHVSREGYNPRPKPDSTKEFLATLTGRDQ